MKHHLALIARLRADHAELGSDYTALVTRVTRQVLRRVSVTSANAQKIDSYIFLTYCALPYHL
jgi:hypothetical protein